MANHYELNYEDSFSWMTNHKQYIYDNTNNKDYGNFQFISSWSNNYKSWKIQKELPVKFIKYEDLLEKTFFITKEIIQFINKITKSEQSINKDKLKNAVNSTMFDKLQEKRKKKVFLKQFFQIKKKTMIPFFNLGPKNDWKKILNNSLKLKIKSSFKSELIELKYK